MLLRIAATGAGQPQLLAIACFYDDRNKCVLEQRAELVPGAPVVFKIHRDKLPPSTSLPYPSVRVVAEVRGPDPAVSDLYATLEFFDKDGPTARRGGTCVPAPAEARGHSDCCDWSSHGSFHSGPGMGGGPITKPVFDTWDLTVVLRR